MSHTTTMTTAMKDLSAIAEAAKELGWGCLRHQEVKLFDGTTHKGTTIRPPGWTYPIVIKADGSVAYDDYNGEWGNVSDIVNLKVEYGVAIARKVYGRRRVQRTTTKTGRTKLVIER